MELKAWLERCPLIAILRGVDPATVLDVAGALEGAGLAIVEVPLNSPRPMESIATLSQWVGARMLVGAGAVLTPAAVQAVFDAGGRLIVTPHAAGDVVSAAKRLGMLACPGFATPTEAFAMLRDGADGLKLFPAEASSPSVLRAMRAVLPAETLVMPVGGIEAGNMRPWLEAGAAGFGIGGAIYKPGNSGAVVADKAARLVAGLAAARGTS